MKWLYKIEASKKRICAFVSQNEFTLNTRERRLTSSSHVFLWDGEEGTHNCPFSKELSIARSRAFDTSCLTRWFLVFQLITEGDSDPEASTT